MAPHSEHQDELEMVRSGKEPTGISIISYHDEGAEVKQHISYADLTTLLSREKKTWLRINGLSDEALIKHVCELFEIHPLVVEDILHPRQRAKVEEYGDWVYVVIRLYHIDKDSVYIEQVSFILKEKLLISIEETHESDFDRYMEKLQAGASQLNKKGTDYLLYTLLDYVIDQYILVLESLSNDIEQLEDAITKHPSKHHLVRLQSMKRLIIQMKKNAWPIRELIAALQRSDFQLFEADNKIYLRDLYDHAIRTIETIETFRDILATLMDLYHSMMSSKMNEIMKTLTIISTIFIPLTFIAGIYGMNFENMPELKWHYGYFIVVGFMLGLVLMMLIFFRKRKWI